MATKKQRTGSAIPSVEECAYAIEMALEAMDPPIEVFRGILRLIAEFAKSQGERQKGRFHTRTERVPQYSSATSRTLTFPTTAQWRRAMQPTKMSITSSARLQASVTVSGV